ncbi:hypothetical protein HY502_01625 [Candidatus Woesebacteria bacterium]|nr:hypothetical protein [Candidatus Woesebacteria bacterium]
MINLFVISSTVAIIITTALFYFTKKSQGLDDTIVQHLFHLNEFMAGQNMMAELKANNLKVSQVMLRTNWIAFYAYTHNGKGPSQNEINQINTENDYLRQINPSLQNFGDFKKILEEPSRSKKKLGYIELGLFIGLVLTQIAIIFISNK